MFCAPCGTEFGVALVIDAGRAPLEITRLTGRTDIHVGSRHRIFADDIAGRDYAARLLRDGANHQANAGYGRSGDCLRVADDVRH